MSRPFILASDHLRRIKTGGAVVAICDLPRAGRGDRRASERRPGSRPPRARPARAILPGGENTQVDLARIAWLVTVLACLVAVFILLVEGYYGYAGVTLAVAASAAINLT